jgi:hypothetical protein
VVEDLARGLGAEAVEQQQDAVPGDGVARIGHHPQVGEHVLDVGGLDELEAATLDERDVPLLQLELGSNEWLERNSTAMSSSDTLAQLEDARPRSAIRPAVWALQSIGGPHFAGPAGPSYFSARSMIAFQVQDRRRW